MVYAISKRIVWPILSLFVKRIEGRENLPKRKFILAANHSSYIDGALLMMFVAWHRNIKLCYFATNKKFTGWFWDKLFAHYGAIRVNGSLEKGIRAVKEGNGIGIFPEGGRTPNGKIQKITHTGLGVLALKTKLPVVPVALNTYNFWNRHHVFPSFKRNICIVVGKPMRFKGKFEKRKARQITMNVMKEVKQLARSTQC